jgi:hypothetical protein
LTDEGQPKVCLKLKINQRKNTVAPLSFIKVMPCRLFPREKGLNKAKFRYERRGK